MIILTRLSGATFAVNPDLIERADATPDTVVTLVDGTKYVVAEPVDVLMDRVLNYRAQVIARSYALEQASMLEAASEPVRPAAEGARDASLGDVVPLHRKGI